MVNRANRYSSRNSRLPEWLALVWIVDYSELIREPMLVNAVSTGNQVPQGEIRPLS